MFQVLAFVGWAVLLVLLLYIWADVREIAGMVKERKRELIRSSFGTRASGKENNVSEGPKEKETKQVQRSEGSAAAKPLKESEEQVLQEVLTEFLG